MPIAYLLVSSNSKSSSNQTGAVGKSFQPFQDEKNETHKAPGLGLDLDIVNLQDLYKAKGDPIKVCETSMHKKDCLKKRSEVLNDIKQHCQKSVQSHYATTFYFTGHGYPDGDLCIETQENPNGERLRIEDIIDMAIECEKTQHSNILYLYIDACFSGRNAERTKQHLMKKKPYLTVWLFCSSGPHYQSITTQVGSLLIASQCDWVNPRIHQKRSELTKKFESRKPLRLFYSFSKQKSEPKIQIKDLKFGALWG